MDSIAFYHYVSKEKLKRINKEGLLKPSTPFNPKIPDKEWKAYSKTFSFPLFRFYTCAFLEPMPKGWREYGLFNLLMEEFAGGDFLLEIKIKDSSTHPILVRDHHFHSPKEYGYPPEIWRRRKIRDSRPDLRNKWYQSAVPFKQYKNNYICLEVLIPFNILLPNIKILKNRLM